MKYLFVVIISIFVIHSYADTLTVKQDGTGDYTIVQDAITAAVDGDTVLVYPGTYFENLEIKHKQITLGSLTLTTGNSTYVHETIINGNQTGGCINVFECPGTVIINGFKLTNGIGTWYGSVSGGGVYVDYSSASFENCIICDNHVTGSGGGIYANYSVLYLSNTIIKNNTAYKWGGGIMLTNSNSEFDTINLCNLYKNTAAIGTDFYNNSYPTFYNHISVDTFTIVNPNYYYVYANNMDSAYPGNSVTWQVNNGKIEQASENLYVAPYGDNNNTGITPDDPLKNIWYALLKMKSDSISPDTIILADGVYSPSTGEQYPLSLKKDVSIRGTSRDGTILDAEDEIYHFSGIPFAENYTISDLTLRNGNGKY